jgi:hypothetical protein
MLIQGCHGWRGSQAGFQPSAGSPSAPPHFSSSPSTPPPLNSHPSSAASPATPPLSASILVINFYQCSWTRMQHHLLTDMLLLQRLLLLLVPFLRSYPTFRSKPWHDLPHLLLNPLQPLLHIPLQHLPSIQNPAHQLPVCQISGMDFCQTPSVIARYYSLKFC